MQCLQADTPPSLVVCCVALHHSLSLLQCTVLHCALHSVDVSFSPQCTVQCCTALQSVDVSPNLCHYLWALCLIRLRRLCWPPCYDTLQYPHVSYQLPMLYNNITIICWPPWYDTLQYPHIMSNHSNAITISLSSHPG